jgi:hypothetical protein
MSTNLELSQQRGNAVSLGVSALAYEGYLTSLYDSTSLGTQVLEA